MNESQIKDRLGKARKDPRLFFGTDGESVLKEMKKATHPDLWPDDKKEEAGAWFREFSSLFEDSKKPKEFIGDYEIVEKISRGDLCDVYLGRKDDLEFIIKRPYVEKARSAMANEYSRLSAVWIKARYAAASCDRGLWPRQEDRKFVNGLIGGE